MKNKRFQLATMIVLALIMVLCIPSSFAKYIKNEKFTVPVKVYYNIDKPKIYYDKVDNVQAYKYSDVANGYKEISIPKDGYYIIITKGGNAGQSYSNSSSGKISSVINGGAGGTVVGYGKFSTSDSFKVYLGSAGGNAGLTRTGNYKYKSLNYYYEYARVNTSGKQLAENGENNVLEGSTTIKNKVLSNAGLAGTNAYGSGLGSDGNTDTRFNSYLTEFAYTSSAGSGAASVVRRGDSLLMVAGGGGASASYVTSCGLFTMVAGGTGGAGGSNVSTSTTGVINGANGTGSGAGYGGGATGGNFGVVGSVITLDIFVQTISERKGASGGDYSNVNSLGNGGIGAAFGGPGGGGYSGGGGGAGFSINESTGGGGGGSSYVDSTLSWNTAKNKIYTDALGKTSFASEKDGWIIVARILAKDKDGKAIEITSMDDLLMS